ncbi:hypothetical protein GCM10027360_32230 [Amycolatopsis echigonensis]
MRPCPPPSAAHTHGSSAAVTFAGLINATASKVDLRGYSSDQVEYELMDNIMNGPEDGEYPFLKDQTGRFLRRIPAPG